MKDRTELSFVVPLTVVTARNLNSSESSMMLVGGESYTGRLLTAASLLDSFVA